MGLPTPAPDTVHEALCWGLQIPGQRLGQRGCWGGTSEDYPPHNCLPDGPKPCWLEVGLWGTTVSVQTPTWHSAQRGVHKPIMVADSWLLGPDLAPLCRVLHRLAPTSGRGGHAGIPGGLFHGVLRHTHVSALHLSPGLTCVSGGVEGGPPHARPCAELGMEVNMSTSLPSWISEGPVDLAGPSEG